MPASVCDNGHLNWYRNQRGNRLANMQCTECGGDLHAAAWDSKTGTYVRRVARSVTGRKFETCAICGKRRSIPGRGQRVTVDSYYFVTHQVDGVWRSDRVLVPAGSMVCTYRHSLMGQEQPAIGEPATA